jgi:hypothetical protein
MGERRHSSEKVCPNLQEVGRGPQLLWGFAIGGHLYPFTVEKPLLTVTYRGANWQEFSRYSQNDFW